MKVAKTAISVLFPGHTYKNMMISIRDGEEWHRHKISLCEAEHLMKNLKLNVEAHKAARDPGATRH